MVTVETVVDSTGHHYLAVNEHAPITVREIVTRLHNLARRIEPGVVAAVLAVAMIVGAALYGALSSSDPVQDACEGHEGTVVTVPAHVVTDNPNIPPNRPVKLGC